MLLSPRRDRALLTNQRLPALLQSVDLPQYLANQILPLLIQSSAFGHATRLDYGTGHELAFVLALWCCVASGWVGSGEGGEDEEDELLLRVFAQYIRLPSLPVGSRLTCLAISISPLCSRCSTVWSQLDLTVYGV